MEREVVVNKVLRDMKLFELVTEENAPFARQFLDAIWVASHEQRTKELVANHKQKVIQYNKEGQEIARYDSIIEAALNNKICLSSVAKSLTGKISFTRKHSHYFRYADENACRGNI